MTREERAIACITEHRGAEYANPKMVRAMLAFADAEAAAMRERAAGVASNIQVQMTDAMRQRGISSDTLVGIVSMAQVADAIAAVIRALPATGEVGRVG